MGRTLATVLVLGLLAGGGWFLWGRDAKGTVPAPAGRTAAPSADGTAAAVPVPGAFVERTAESATAPATPAGTGTAEAVAEIRSHLQAGRAREAVARASGLTTEALRDPAGSAAARDAGLALAAAVAAGPPDRLAQAEEARRLLARLAVEDAAPTASVWDRIEVLNREVLFSGKEQRGVLFRGAVKPGDTLDRLMRTEWKGRVKAGYGVVLWLNGIPSPDRLRAGTIWVPEEPIRFLVRKRDHVLWVLLGGVPVRRFPVGLGMNGRTPEGTFEIEELMPRPDYWPVGGKRIPFGQKGNPLGTRWMGFRDTPEAQGFGIHGTDDPGSIGKDLSQGCVRLANADVEQLFTWAAVGTLVEIRP